ncbi:MAG TPA: imidazolonepropionase [Candidatus Limnocylindria bacterium]
MPPGQLLLSGTGRLLVAQPHAAEPPGTLSPWALLIRDGRIGWVGSPDEAPAVGQWEDLGSALVTPGLVDSHTHPVFAGDRADEAAARLEGQPYAAGGILRTVAATRQAPDAELQALVEDRFRAALAGGTTTLEAKSGYGLTTVEELRALRIIGAAATAAGIRVVRTFLGAHAVPPEAASPEAYVSTVIEDMLPAVAGEAEFCDVFCDRGFFTSAQAEAILTAARGRGMGLKLHADQLARTGAAELGVRLGATSVDHLEQLDAAGVRALAASATVATLLPGPAVAMRDRLPPARALLDAGASVALATDANAGTYANPSMPLVIGLGATLLGMSVQEAIAAATAGGAAAIGLSHEIGVLREGMAADLVAWDAEHEGAFALRLGGVAPARIWIGGEERALS